ncbi:integrase [Gossypium australe]|uniref:Integrase n=1 Tax=Gossypium australe TaxID=47621 RepID=A0A5B6X2F9_9ROSI|nr:integrase [Gossypium australe]
MIVRCKLRELNDCLMFRDRVCVPKDDELIRRILHKTHNGYLSWSGMKRDISEFVTKCLIYQQVKVEHQVPSGLL